MENEQLRNNLIALTLELSKQRSQQNREEATIFRQLAVRMLIPKCTLIKTFQTSKTRSDDDENDSESRLSSIECIVEYEYIVKGLTVYPRLFCVSY